ncbi:MAG: response regulator [Alphaproteobacteria bacterium]
MFLLSLPRKLWHFLHETLSDCGAMVWLSVYLSSLITAIIATFFNVSEITIFSLITSVSFISFCLTAGFYSLVAKRQQRLRREAIKAWLDECPAEILRVAEDNKGKLIAISAAGRYLPEVKEQKPVVSIIGGIFRYAPDALQQLQLLEDTAKSGHDSEAVMNYQGEKEENSWLKIKAIAANHMTVKHASHLKKCVLWQVESLPPEDHPLPTSLDPLLPRILAENPVGILLIDHTGKPRFANEHFCMLANIGEDELLSGKITLEDLFLDPPNTANPSYPISFFALHGSNGENREILLNRSPQLANLWVKLWTHGLSFGSVAMRTLYIKDIAHEKELEQQLLQSEKRFNRFFHDAPIGIAMVDSDGKLADCNEALAIMSGFPLKELEGRSVADIFLSVSLPAVLARLAEIREGVANPRPVEAIMRGDKEIVAQLYTSPITRPDNSVDSIILRFVDMTEQKNLELQFVQSQKMQAVGQLAGGIAHDFNNLLTAIIGFCDLLLLRHKPGDPSFGDIMQIKQNSNRAANLVRQLLAFSRQQTLQPRILNINDVVSELSHLVRRLIGENIELKVQLARDLGLVKVDQGQLEQVLVNLVVNARDAMNKGGRLTLSTRNMVLTRPMRLGTEEVGAGAWILISVADTGVGIPRENIQRIFEPFFSTKEIGSGTGLGLSTVYGIVRQTGGFVFVESEIGEGSCFTIYLPQISAAQLEEMKAIEEPQQKKTQLDLTGAGRILLVEDEDAVRSFSARALRNKGYQVFEAHHGEQALEVLAKEEKFDLLITDVIMPGIDGPTLVKKIRETDPEMKVIFISGYTEDRFRGSMDPDSHIHFLGKPFSLKQLAEKVREVTRGEH